MSRSLMRHTIAELEQLFNALKTDPKTLEALEEELQHRHMPRAVALLAKVQETLKILKGVKSASSPNTASESTIVPGSGKQDLNLQSDLWCGQSTPVPQIAPKLAVAQQKVIRPDNRSEPSLEALAPSRDHGDVTGANRGMSIDEAYKILKATSSSTWEAIEQARRQIVQQAHPERLAALGSAQRADVEAEAKRANAASAVLRQLRIATFQINLDDILVR